MIDGLKIAGILLMAGTGSRFGSGMPKQFHRLAGKEIYQHTLECFMLSGLFDELFLVCPPERVESLQREVPISVHVIAGGDSRQESSYLGLIACQTADIVCIHDAVRPFVTQEILRENISKAREFGAVNTCIPSTDTLVFAPLSEMISAIPARKDFLRGQTPQTFRYSLILQAHQLAREKGITERSDDCSLVLDMGHPVHAAPGNEHNIKITTGLDLSLAEQIFRLVQHQIPSSSPFTLVGKHYIVTGGTGSIGKEVCEGLKKEGAIPIPLSRSSTRYSADLSSYSSTLKAFEEIEKAFGPIDGLINCIGYLKLGSLADLSQEEIDKQISTNLKALIFCCKCASLKKGAHIINIASSSYARGRKDFTVYACAKAAVVNFSQGLAEERPDLIINAIVPQRTKTPMRLSNFTDEDQSSLLDPKDVAQEIIALLKQDQLKGSILEIRKRF